MDSRASRVLAAHSDVRPEVIYRPPMPSQVVRVAVSGHRRLDEAEPGSIQEGLKALLASGFAPAKGALPPAFVLISQLAEGADQLAAKAMPEKGWQLDALIPFAPVQDYRSTFCDPEKNWPEFEKLAGKARATFRLDGKLDDQRSAFRIANWVMLANCDILLAVWDASREGKAGGTREVVEAAVTARIPVVVVDPGKPGRPHLKWVGFEAMPLATTCVEDLPERDVGELSRFIAALCEPPRDASALGVSLADYFGERQRRINLGVPLAWPLVQATMFVRAVGWRDVVDQRYVFGARDDWAGFLAAMPRSDTKPEELEDRDTVRPWHEAQPLDVAIENTLLGAFAFADRLGVHYAQLYRGAFTLTFLLSAVAIVLGPVSVLADVSFANRVWLIGAEIAVVATILVLLSLGTKRKWHRRWLAYRELAEHLRHMRLLSLVAAPGTLGRVETLAASETDPAAPTAREQHTAFVAWYARAIRRTLPLPDAVADTAYLEKVRAAAIGGCGTAPENSELGGQLDYHGRNAERSTKLDDRLHRTARILFMFTIALTLAYLAVAWFAFRGVGDGEILAWLAVHEAPIKAVFSFVVSSALTLAAALGAIRVQADLDETALRSREVRATLAEIMRAMATEPVTYGRLTDRLSKASEAMAADLNEWHTLFRARPLSVPAEAGGKKGTSAGAPV